MSPETYLLLIKHLHRASALLSIGGFMARLAGAMAQRRWAQPAGEDAAALERHAAAGQCRDRGCRRWLNPLQTPWLATKIVLLFAYIGSGMLELSTRCTPVLRRTGGGACAAGGRAHRGQPRGHQESGGFAGAVAGFSRRRVAPARAAAVCRARGRARGALRSGARSRSASRASTMAPRSSARPAGSRCTMIGDGRASVSRDSSRALPGYQRAAGLHLVERWSAPPRRPGCGRCVSPSAASSRHLSRATGRQALAAHGRHRTVSWPARPAGRAGTAAGACRNRNALTTVPG